MDRYYKKLSMFLINNKYIDSNDAELYEYATKVLFQSIINTVVTIAIGLIFGMLKECLCFIAVFMILRKFTGGLHAKKYINCLLGSIFLIIISLVIIKFLGKYNFQIEFLYLVGISIMVICVLAPMEHYNKTLKSKEKKVYKCISVILSLCFYVICLLLINNNFVIAYSFGTALMNLAILLIISYLKSCF